MKKLSCGMMLAALLASAGIASADTIIYHNWRWCPPPEVPFNQRVDFAGEYVSGGDAWITNDPDRPECVLVKGQGDFTVPGAVRLPDTTEETEVPLAPVF